MYGLGPKFWQELFLLLTIVLLSLVSFNAVMRKLLKVEKKKLFSYNYVNEKHKKIDRTIRITSIVVLLIGSFVNMTRDPMDWIWFFEPWFLMMVFVLATEVARAIIEYKYAENRNDYKFTISQLVFIVIIFFTLYWSDFLGMANL
ncbi:DUF4181 domain-containing protein [Desulfosporosinus sp. BICA1-9]|uniref:DUF4181 domain-containing protein n=1 Tax=Desulfosporosinus sp. BICA1-9 TaxID=1531958 RepID=UPI00054BE8D7|nr:DUF4181 domain-containing protein [Desulfosporosinus sp. BICA1-9]KJS47648.1 MAG: hypothetical protein VR66_18455 [Peptococcaceae bacterium BRH_c23]KJS89149.1 MAG: hypothetical protein JL57_09050 [Desulfosporosinus sp. BICA1-9]HBW38527.1 DUF4181 domain-containing protein [Desulfosporosinus sp.]